VIESQPLAASQLTIGESASWLPRRGDQVGRLRNGVTFSGKVFYADQLQVLVKWENGSSSSFRVDKGELREIRPL
jgi:hypothetical protein